MYNNNVSSMEELPPSSFETGEVEGVKPPAKHTTWAEIRARHNRDN